MTMRVDPHTQAELEILWSREGRTSLFDLLDRTATTGGSNALRARFARPMASASEIRAVQEAVRFLIDHEVRCPVADRTAAAVGRYLESRYAPVGAGRGPRLWIEALWIGIRYRDLVREARTGLLALHEVAQSLTTTLGTIGRSDLPPLLVDLVQRGEAALARPAVRRLLERGPGFADWLVRTLRFDRQVRTGESGAAQAILQILFELDALCSMAHATRELGWAFPELIDDAEEFALEAEGLRHPFLGDPVKNDVRVSGGETLIFLTGPNMAGKTTYLRAAAVAVYLAQLGMGVPADHLRLTPVECLVTSLEVRDDLRRGLSFFMAEVRRVKEVATLLAEGHRCFVVFDEVFKGTNVRDALEASKAVIVGFARSRRSGFIFASHLTELVAELEGLGGIRFACFEGEIVEGVASYSYQVREGFSDQRFGLQLFEQEEIPRLLEAIPG